MQELLFCVHFLVPELIIPSLRVDFILLTLKLIFTWVSRKILSQTNLVSLGAWITLFARMTLRKENTEIFKIRLLLIVLALIYHLMAVPHKRLESALPFSKYKYDFYIYFYIIMLSSCSFGAMPVSLEPLSI